MLSSRRPSGELDRTLRMRVVMDSLRRIVRELRLSAREVERGAKISSAQLFVLETLADEAPCSIATLSERTLTDPSSVSVVTKRLVDAKLVSRKDSADDARQAALALTAAGRRLISRYPDPTQARLLGAMAELSQSELSALSLGLAALVRGMGMEEATPRMFFEDEAPPARRAPSRAGQRASRRATTHARG
jgi:DNA-binding MarR family transcriptional regulator